MPLISFRPNNCPGDYKNHDILHVVLSASSTAAAQLAIKFRTLGKINCLRMENNCNDYGARFRPQGISIHFPRNL